MVDALGTAFSGMQVARYRHDTVADNIANANSPDFRASEVQSAESLDGGIVVTGKVVTGTEDLVSDFVGLDIAIFAFRANAISAKTAEDSYSAILEMGK